MILTVETAKNNIGRYIDCYSRKFGYYPMQIKERTNGQLYIKDGTGTCMDIVDAGFNATHYDYIFDLEEEE